jgi:hypothetical protein
MSDMLYPKGQAEIADVGEDLPSDIEASPETPELEQSIETPWHEAYAEGIHGVEVQELLQALANGTLPEALLDKLQLDLQDGDQQWKGTVKDLQQGAMMRANYTRKSQELAQEQKQFHAERGEMVEYFKNWQQDPQQLLFGLHRMGMPVLKMTELLTTQLTKAEAMNNVNPGSGDEWLQAVFQKSEMDDLKRRMERQNQSKEQEQHSKKEEQLKTQIRSASTEIFKEIGLELEESSWELYKQHTQLIYDNKPVGQNGRKGLSRADLKKAAEATKSQLEQYARNYQARAGKQAPGAQLGTVKLDAGGPTKVPARAPQRKTQKTTAEVLAEINTKNGFRQR